MREYIEKIGFFLPCRFSSLRILRLISPRARLKTPDLISIFPVDTGRKLNVHKTFRRRPVRLLNVLYTFNLRPVSRGLRSSEIKTFLKKDPV